MTLDRYFEATHLTPSVVKIDVEGAEVKVLRGAAEVLRHAHPVLIVSMHPFWMPPPDSAAGALAFLSRLGYSVKASHVVEIDRYEAADYLLTA